MTRNTLYFFFLLAALTPAAAAGAKSQEPSPEELALTIRLYDYAEPGEAILSRAREEAEQALARIGIAARWLDCPLTMEELETNKACAAEAGPTDLVLQILPSGSRPAVSSQVDTFGYALIGDSEMPRTASVLFANVERLAWQRLEDSSFDSVHRSIPHHRYVGVLLGHVITHEVGHLLLATNKHSRNGLMQAHWNANAIRDAMIGRLAFAPREENRMRKLLSARQAAEEDRRAPNARLNLAPSAKAGSGVTATTPAPLAPGTSPHGRAACRRGSAAR